MAREATERSTNLESRIDEAMADTHRVLQGFFRLAGRGSVRRVERALGLSEGNLAKWRQRKRMSLSLLFRALRRLGGPAHFWSLVYPEVPLAAGRPGLPEDPVVRRALAAEDEDDARARELSEEELRRLDGLYREGRRLAVRKAKLALKHATREQRPRLLAVYGTARLRRGHLAAALAALHRALELHDLRGGRAVRADILGRLAAAYDAAGCSTMAYLFAREAWYELRLAGDRSGEPRARADVLARRRELVRRAGVTASEGAGELVSRVHRVLQRFFRLNGWGSVRRVEHAVGLRDGAVRIWRRKKQLELRNLFRVLGELGEPAHFWSEVFPDMVLTRPSRPAKDPVVRRALSLAGAGDEGDSSDSPAGELEEEALRRLDGLRYENPRRAFLEAKAALFESGPRQVPTLLAIYGSARRAQGRLDQAFQALEYAFELARRRGERDVQADVLQRLGVAYAYSGDVSRGLFYAKEAWFEFRALGDAAGEGRSLVDQGARLLNMDRLDDSTVVHELALRVLPATETLNRFATSLWLAVSYRRKGDHGRALNHAIQGEKSAPQCGIQLAVLCTTQAEIYVDLQRIAEAERCYVRALEIYSSASPLDAALVASDLARLQLSQGEVATALSTIKSMARFVESLGGEGARQAVMTLIRGALTGRVTLTILDRCTRVIRREREREADAAVGSRPPFC